MIAFLKKWFKESRKFAPDPQPTPHILENETIARFLLSKNHFARTKNIVKYRAFLPNRDGETSVYRTTGIVDAEIWQMVKYLSVDLSQKVENPVPYIGEQISRQKI